LGLNAAPRKRLGNYSPLQVLTGIKVQDQLEVQLKSNGILKNVAVPIEIMEDNIRNYILEIEKERKQLK
jgi:hypothetical protein